MPKITKPFCLIISLFFALAAQAANLSQVRFHNVDSDTAVINQMLVDVAAMKLPASGDRVVEIATRFMGKPYVANTLEGDPEMLTVNIDEFDCTTFVETVAAMAITLNENRSSWRDFLFNLERLRYRSGLLNGYPSRLHYICDWAVDNMHRGNIAEATTQFPKYNQVTRTIDFMSENASKYPALADSATLAAIKNVEVGYRGYRFNYIKTIDLGNKLTKGEFKNGDIVALVTNIKNLDIAHMGIIVMKKGEPYLLHASSSAGKVVLTEVPFADFMKKNRQFLGCRVFRVL